MAINTVYKCQLKAVWFTRTIYCDKYLYAMHQKLHIIGTNEDFDKIIPLGERLEEVQRLARLAKQIKLIEVFIQWKQYNPKEPFFVRSGYGNCRGGSFPEYDSPIYHQRKPSVSTGQWNCDGNGRRTPNLRAFG